MAKARIHYANQVPLAATVLSASSAQSANPVSWLKDQLRSKTWRSKVGWNVVAGFNRLLDFSEDATICVATLTVGNFATGAAMATNVQDAMNAAPGHTNTYTVTYSATTKKFTITRVIGAKAVVLKWQSGANAAISCGQDLGFDVTADDSGAGAYTGDRVTYKSREYVQADFGAAITVKSCVAINHNDPFFSPSSSSLTLFGDSTPLDMAAPLYSHRLAGDADTLFYQTSGAGESARYWWIVFDDCANPLGYSELGVWFNGSYAEPSVNYSIGYSEETEDLSTLEFGASGAGFQIQRPQRRRWGLEWSEVLSADLAILTALRDAMPVGSDFFFAFQPDDSADLPVYVHREGFSASVVSGPYYNVSLPIAESLG